MSDSSGVNSNSWTLLAAEENVAATLRPVAEGGENHADTLDPAGDMGDVKAAVSAERERSEDSWQTPQEVDLERMKDAVPHVQHNSDAAHDPHVTPDPAHDPHVTPEPAHNTHVTLEPTHDPHVTPDLTSVTNDHLPSSVEVLASFDPDHDPASQLAGSSESHAPPSSDPDSSSESYTHISPSVEEGSGYQLTVETLGAEKLAEEEAEEAELTQEEDVHQLNGEELGQEKEESELSQRVNEDGKQAVNLVDQLVRDLFHIWARKLAGQAVAVPSVGDEWTGDGRGEESGVRRRRGSLLAALERIGRRDEEEEETEDFRLPQRDEESGFSLNKCILGAIILLGLGTIFFSGVFMDLDEEGEYDIRQMGDAEVTGKQEWLNPEVPPLPVGTPELQTKQSEEHLQAAMLQDQLLAQTEKLTAVQDQAAEGEQERQWREALEEENGRLKKEASALPGLLKENDKMKRELASVPALQREVERLRATLTELKHAPASGSSPPPVSPATAPPPGPEENGSLNTDSPAEEERRTSEEGEGKEEKKSEWRAGHEKDKEEPGHGKQEKGWKERGEKPQKKGEKKEWKPEKDWKKEKHDEVSDVHDWKKREEKKGWKGKEEKTGEWKKERESRGDEGKPWKNREDKKEGEGKGKYEKDGKGKDEKDWKKSERKEWKSKGEKKEKKGGKKYEDKKEWKDEGKKWKDEEKKWKDEGKKWKDEGKKEWKDEEKKEWKDEGKKEWKDEGKKKGNQKKEWGERQKDKGERKSDKDWKKKEEKQDGDRDWRRKEEQRPWQGKEKKEKEWSREGDRKKEKQEESWKREEGGHHHKHKHDKHEYSHHVFTDKEGGKKERLKQSPGETSLPHSHRSPPMEQPNYWLLQRERLQHNPSPQTKCTSVDTCAQAEGLLPVPLPEFEALLLGYLAKAEGVGVEASRREELRQLATEFFRDGVFAHDQMSFRDFVEDVGDILEDMVDGEEDDDDDDEEGGIEEEMDGFDEEAMRKFAVPGGGEKMEKKRGERMKEAVRGRG